jgi:glycosyltransferase involved in cell wall biosynthesis
MILSTVIPAYNVEKFILPAVESVLSQNFTDMEVIVVDDGSTDGTVPRLASITDRRVKLITQPNKGLAGARNTGIKAAQGKYIALLDADDVWCPTKIDKQISLMEEDSTIGFTYTYSAYIDEYGKPTGQLWITSVAAPSYLDLIIRNHVMASSVVVRRDCFSQAGIFNEELRACEDQELWVRILHKTNYQGRLIPEVLAGYRVRSDSLTLNFEHQLLNARRVMDIFAASYPDFSPKLRNRSLSEAYRIASRKALSEGQLEVAGQLMREALQLCPTLVLRDPRALVTFMLVTFPGILPKGWQHRPYHWTRALLKLFYRHYLRGHYVTS